jgi:hypothetical protein
MANIRISAQVVTSLSAFAAAASINAAVTMQVAVATPDYASRMSMTVDIVSAKQLADGVLPQDQIAFGPEKVFIDIATATEDVALVVEKALESEINPVEGIDTFEVDRVSTDSVDAQDAPAITLDRPDVVDAVAPEDVATLQPGKNVADEVLAGDTLNSFDIGKTLDSSVTMLDAISAFGVDQAIDTALTVDTVKIKEVGKALEDSTGTEDAAALDVGKTLTDSAEPADAVSAFEAGKALTDSAEPADAAAFAVEVGALASSAQPEDAAAFDADKVLADAANPADALTAFTVDKLLAHSVAPADAAPVLSFTKGLAHSVTMGDNFVYELVLGESFPLYDFAFIADGKFTSFPVPGTINSHLIHEPLVNGEFVLTIDPNAGIVYDIRTESESYMFAGYTLNGNQFN